MTGWHLNDGDLLVIISSDSAKTIISDSANRWEIETLFGRFKTGKFWLESTHFTDSKRLSKSLALMTLALYWAMKTELHEHQPLKVKKRRRFFKHIFCYVLYYLRSNFINLELRNNELSRSLKFLYHTYNQARKLFFSRYWFMLCRS